MSNEQVLLAMVINRLKLLLDMHEELKSKWSAEITELILLGEGVLIATPENRTTDGQYVLTLDTTDEVVILYEILHGETRLRDYNDQQLRGLRYRLDCLYDSLRPTQINPPEVHDDNA